MSCRPLPRCISVLSAALAIGCGSREASAPKPAFPVVFAAVDDDGDPLPAATFLVAERPIGTTDASGKIAHAVAGREGQVLAVSASCPPGFESAETHPALRLTETHRVDTQTIEPIIYRVTCTRTTRDIVVVVRAQRGRDLPVEIDGKPLGMTDADGIAHVLVRLDRRAPSVAVGLDTRGQRDLRPQNPSRTFELSGRDTVIVFEQSFARDIRRLTSRHPAQSRHIPERID
jgi:hypothetical protein